VQLIQNIQSAGGVTVSYVAVQNEPNVNGNVGSGANSGFGACGWSAAALDSQVQALGSAFTSAGLSTKIILGEAYDYANSSNYFGACLSDSSCNSHLSVVSGHGYGYPDTPIAPGSGGYPALSAGYHIWQGETADNEATSFNSGMLDSGGAAGALTMAENMHNFLVTGQVSSYNWWELGYIDNSGGTCQNCELVDQNLDFTKRFYAFGNFSKFVRPGMVMIGATNNPQSGVYVSAYLKQSNSFAIVVVNTNSSPVSQTFNLSGLSAGSVTPYITDNNNNLAGQSSVPISASSFTSTLTPSSVTTFVATGNGPGGPSHLIATVPQ
jgi:O-glycosyl hydrolase